MRVLLLLSLLFSIPTSAVAEDPAALNRLTIYSSAMPGAIRPEQYRPTPGGSTLWHYNSIPGYAIVRKKHEVSLGNNNSEVKFSDVAAFIDPTTVTFKSLTDPDGTSVLEQNYNFDLVSINKLAERYIDKTVSFEKHVQSDKPPQVMSGKLLSAQNGQLVVQAADGTIVTTHANQTIFPKLPGELYTKPTLIWKVKAARPGKHEVETSYETGGMTWWADYNVIYTDGKTANGGFLDIGAWVSIINKSGASYPDSKLKLIAGDVQRTQNASPTHMYAKRKMAMMEGSSADGFKEKSFFEYHLYTLGRTTSLPENSTKQIELFPLVSKVPVDKVMVYNGSANNQPYYGGINYDKNFGTHNGNKKVDVYLKFKNSAKHGMGMPLPKGRIRVNKLDIADDTLEFIGEDKIDHTPKNENILLRLGNAFDVVGERTQTDFKVNLQKKWMMEKFKITLHNHKAQDVQISVKESLNRGVNWNITSSTDKHTKQDAHNIEYKINIPKDGEKVISYKVEYTW